MRRPLVWSVSIIYTDRASTVVVYSAVNLLKLGRI